MEGGTVRWTMKVSSSQILGCCVTKFERSRDLEREALDQSGQGHVRRLRRFTGYEPFS